MKKKLESRLQQLAGQILSEASSQNTTQLKEMARELYDNLLVLEYLEKQMGGKFLDESLDSKSYREHNWFKDPEPLPEPENKEELIEPAIEKIKDIVAQMPTGSEEIDQLLEEVLPKSKVMKNDLEEFASHYKDTPVFERKETTVKPTTSTSLETESISEEKATLNTQGEKVKSLNDRISKGFSIGLNDRLAFVKHLFDDNEDDFKRVMSQLNTMESHEEALHFIKTKVKPDYNYWLQKDTFAERFMVLIEKKFES